jgi:dienelactone hydrolase
MRLRLFAAIAAVSFSVALAHGHAAEAGSSEVTFQSSSYLDFRQLLSGQPPAATVTLSATLNLPEETRDRYPAVVVVHTIAGYLDNNEGQYAAELRRAGFATLTYDSFAARGTTGIALARSGPGLWPSGVADAYAALKLLAGHPRIDPGRIAIAGFSYGGEIAHLAALEGLHEALRSGPARFATHVAYYPAGVFGAVAQHGAYTGSPVLMLLGEKDDNLPVAKVENYLAYAKAAGFPAPVETVVYPGAYHAWTVPSLTTLRFYPEYASTKRCPLILLGSARPALLVEGELKPFDPGSFGACMGAAPGYSMVYDAALRARSTAESIGFLERICFGPRNFGQTACPTCSGGNT